MNAFQNCVWILLQVGESGKPVIVWIHPMRFTEESAYGPQYFGVGHYMVQDVVLVTVRYRHNVLGKYHCHSYRCFKNLISLH